jgi:hypothetical protein
MASCRQCLLKNEADGPREVYVGINCERTVGQLAKIIRDNGPVRQKVTLHKTRASFRNFEVVKQKLVTPLIVHPAKGHIEPKGLLISNQPQSCE